MTPPVILAFLAGFVAFPVCVSVVGLVLWRHDRKVMRGMRREEGGR